MNSMQKINLIVKEIRATVIKHYLQAAGLDRCVCFTSGNAAKYLRAQGVNVLAVGEKENIKPMRWHNAYDIARFGMFDATSGNLPMTLIIEIANLLKVNHPDYIWDKKIECGSGETFLICRIAYPNEKLLPYYNNDNLYAAYNENAPLNKLVSLLS